MLCKLRYVNFDNRIERSFDPAPPASIFGGRSRPLLPYLRPLSSPFRVRPAIAKDG